MIEIRHKNTAEIITTVDCLVNTNLSYALNVPGASLRARDFCRSRLCYTNFRGADLYGSCFCHTNLYHADLSETTLTSASFDKADLSECNLRHAIMPWTSHDVVSELLRRNAGDNSSRRSIAGLLLVSRDWCWENFLSLEHPDRDWAIQTLAAYVQKDDYAPMILAQERMDMTLEYIELMQDNITC